MSLGVAHGTLTLGTTSGLSFGSGSNGSGAMTFTGTLTAVNAALDGLVYAPALNYYGPESLTITTNDLGHNPGPAMLSDTDVVAITVTPVNDAPVAVDDSASTAEDTFVDIEVSANDTDVDNGNAALKVAGVRSTT